MVVYAAAGAGTGARVATGGEAIVLRGRTVTAGLVPLLLVPVAAAAPSDVPALLASFP